MLVWRFVIVLFKSALMLALLELLSPVAGAIGLQFKFVAAVASAISHATAMPYRQAETLFLFLLTTTLLEVTRFVWDLITG